MFSLIFLPFKRKVVIFTKLIEGLSSSHLFFFSFFLIFLIKNFGSLFCLCGGCGCMVKFATWLGIDLDDNYSMLINLLLTDFLAGMEAFKDSHQERYE